MPQEPLAAGFMVPFRSQCDTAEGGWGRDTVALLLLLNWAQTCQKQWRVPGEAWRPMLGQVNLTKDPSAPVSLLPLN